MNTRAGAFEIRSCHIARLVRPDVRPRPEPTLLDRFLADHRCELLPGAHPGDASHRRGHRDRAVPRMLRSRVRGRVLPRQRAVRRRDMKIRLRDTRSVGGAFNV